MTGDVTILHDGRHYRVRFLRANDRAHAVVCFEYWKPAPTLEGEFSAEGFLRHRGLNGIGILAAENDWFLHPEIDDVLAAIRAATAGWHLIGYGGSMGAYAAVNYADALGLRFLALVIPQFSIDAAKAPYESRWREEAARLDFTRDRIADRPPHCRGWILFDPACVDGRHVADIRRTHALGTIAVRFGGHAQMLMLQQADVYTGLVIDLLAERFDPAAFRRAWRAARRRSAVFWLGLGWALLARGQVAGAARAASYARALPHPTPADVAALEAAVRAALPAAVATLPPSSNLNMPAAEKTRRLWRVAAWLLHRGHA